MFTNDIHDIMYAGNWYYGDKAPTLEDAGIDLAIVKAHEDEFDFSYSDLLNKAESLGLDRNLLKQEFYKNMFRLGII